MVTVCLLWDGPEFRIFKLSDTGGGSSAASVLARNASLICRPTMFRNPAKAAGSRRKRRS